MKGNHFLAICILLLIAVGIVAFCFMEEVPDYPTMKVLEKQETPPATMPASIPAVDKIN